MAGGSDQIFIFHLVQKFFSYLQPNFIKVWLEALPKFSFLTAKNIFSVIFFHIYKTFFKSMAGGSAKIFIMTLSKV